MKTGKVSESVLKRSVLKQIKTKNSAVISGAALGEDCAIFALQEGELVALTTQTGCLCRETDCMESLLTRVMNNLAAGKAAAKAVMISILLPENTPEQEIREYMQEAEGFCKKNGLQIAGGQTQYSPLLATPVVTVTGYGTRQKTDTCKIKPGQDVVISKWIGLEGTAILAKKYKERLLQRYPAYLVEEAAGFHRYMSVTAEAATAMKSGVCGMHDASRGGIFATLWEMAEGAGVGLKIDLKKLPLRQETVEVCELLGENPYELLSGGCLVMTSFVGDALVEALQEENIPAVVVGQTTDRKDRILVNEDEIRFMDRPRGDLGDSGRVSCQ